MKLWTIRGTGCSPGKNQLMLLPPKQVPHTDTGTTLFNVPGPSLFLDPALE